MTRNYTKNGSFDTLKTEIVDSKHLIMNRLTHKQRSSKHNSPTYTGEMKDALKEEKRELPTVLDLRIPYQISRASWSAQDFR